MADTFKKVRNGDKLRIPASTYNAMVDAAQDYVKRKNNLTAESGNSLPANMIYVKNQSGAAVDRLNILGINGSAIDSASNSFKQTIIFSGTAPTGEHSNGRFVITAEPIAPNSVGRAYIAGFAAVRIFVENEADNFADIYENDVTQLKSAQSGPAVILWKAAGTGSVQAVVRFGGSGGGSGSQFVLGIIIEQPMYSIDGVPGRNYYTVRLISDTTQGWNGSIPYILNDFCIGSNGKKYISLQGTAESPNLNHDPVDSPDWWSQDEEVRVTKIWGAQNLGQLIIDSIPWVEVGEKAMLYQDASSGEFYIILPSIQYAGTEDEANLRYNPNTKCVQAVFK